MKCPLPYWFIHYAEQEASSSFQKKANIYLDLDANFDNSNIVDYDFQKINENDVRTSWFLIYFLGKHP